MLTKAIWILWFRFNILSYSAHSGGAVQVTTTGYVHFLILHCSKSESGCTVAKSSIPSCKDLNYVFLSAYSMQKPLLLLYSLISLSNTRHYMLPVIVLCHMLSFNCVLYPAVASILLFFFFLSFISGYMAFHHLYIMNDFFDPGNIFWLLSCLCSPLLCPPLSEIALIFLLEISSDYCSCCHFVPSVYIC